MPPPLRNWFSTHLARDRDFLLAQLLHLDPAIQTYNQRQQEQLVCDFARRHIFTGTGSDNPPVNSGFPARSNDNGIDIARWWIDFADLNEGLGPRTLCGTMTRGYAAYMAVLGHFVRLVGAVGPHGPDNQAEYWDREQRTWVFRNVGCGVIYRHRLTNRLLSYQTMSQLARQGHNDLLVALSPTGRQALHPMGDRYADWTLWRDDAAVSNGNCVMIGQPHDWLMMRVWPPQPGVASVWAPRWTAEGVPQQLLYPDPTITTPSTA